MRLGKLELKALEFYGRVGVGKWHSFSKDQATKQPILSLARKGLLTVDKDQAKLTEKGHTEYLYREIKTWNLPTG